MLGFKSTILLCIFYLFYSILYLFLSFLSFFGLGLFSPLPSQINSIYISFTMHSGFLDIRTCTWVNCLFPDNAASHLTRPPPSTCVFKMDFNYLPILSLMRQYIIVLYSQYSLTFTCIFYHFCYFHPISETDNFLTT